MTDCDKKERLIIVQGDFTGYGDVDWLKLNPTSDVWDLATMHATFELNGIVKTFDDLTQPFSINYEAAETASMPLGDIDGILRFYDSNDKPVTIDNLIPVTVVKYVHGDAVKTGNYEMNIEVKQGDEVVMEVLVEAGVSVEPGNTYTVDPGEPARIVNRGTASHLILDFYIPKGETGEKGEPGKPGEQGIPGKDGADGKDATINGVNTLTLTATDGLNLAQSGNVATLSGKSIQDSVTTEATNRSNADNNLQQQIDAIAASSDVTDIVGTHADLEDYDTSKLKDNDIIKVLQDETEGGATTYYRWSTHTNTFTLIGEEGPYYTKGDADAKFVPKTRTINNKALDQNITLSASDVGAATAAQGAKADTALQDATVDGTSIVNNGVAVIPIAAQNVYGVVKLGSTTSGLQIASATGNIGIVAATENNLNEKTNAYRPVVSTNLDYATKRGLAYNSVTLTDAEKESACSWLGAEKTPNTEAITSGTSFECADNTIYDGGSSAIANVTCTLPATIPADYSVQINFTSGTTATTFTYDNSIKWVDGCDDIQAVSGVNKFVPVASKRYTVVFISNGVEVIANAKGV